MKKITTLILTAAFIFGTATATVYAMPRDTRSYDEYEEYEEYEETVIVEEYEEYEEY